MSVIKWKECYETKIVSLDNEHKCLVEQINLLYDAIRQRRSEEVMLGIFDQLVDYTKHHFSHEEALLEEYGYQELAVQQKQHQRLAQDVCAYRSKLEQGETLSAKEVMAFLRHWLLDHIVEHDLKYGPYLESRVDRLLS